MAFSFNSEYSIFTSFIHKSSQNQIKDNSTILFCLIPKKHTTAKDLLFERTHYN